MQEAEKAGCSRGSRCVVPSFLNFEPTAFPRSKFKGLVYVHENKLNSTCRLVTIENVLRLLSKQMYSLQAFEMLKACGKKTKNKQQKISNWIAWGNKVRRKHKPRGQVWYLNCVHFNRNSVIIADTGALKISPWKHTIVNNFPKKDLAYFIVFLSFFF